MRWPLMGLCLCVVGGGAAAQAIDESMGSQREGASPTPGWRVQAWAEQSSVADGLPVLALERANWYRGLSGIEEPSRAARRLQARAEATHPSGWRMGWVGRSQVTLTASRDAVELARIDASGQDPEGGQSFAIQAHAMGWTGQGLTLGTPWLQLAPTWGLRTRLDAQWLQLHKLRQGDLSGQVRYSGPGVYDAGLSSDRLDPRITGPYLGSSDARGSGGSLSVAVAAEPVPGWQMELQVDDVWSRLAWGRLARETAVLNTQVTTRAADGSLEFAPLIKGRQGLSRVNTVMGARWTATLKHPVTHDQPAWGHWNVRWTRCWAGLDETWLGWHSSEAPRAWQWQIALEPQRRVLAVGARWRGWKVGLATDGESAAATRYRRLSVGWSSAL